VVLSRCQACFTTHAAHPSVASRVAGSVRSHSAHPPYAGFGSAFDFAFRRDVADRLLPETVLGRVRAKPSQIRQAADSARTNRDQYRRAAGAAERGSPGRGCKTLTPAGPRGETNHIRNSRHGKRGIFVATCYAVRT
jgi:hypothetical protein